MGNERTAELGTRPFWRVPSRCLQGELQVFSSPFHASQPHSNPYFFSFIPFISFIFRFFLRPLPRGRLITCDQNEELTDLKGFREETRHQSKVSDDFPLSSPRIATECTEMCIVTNICTRRMRISKRYRRYSKTRMNNANETRMLIAMQAGAGNSFLQRKSAENEKISLFFGTKFRSAKAPKILVCLSHLSSQLGNTSQMGNEIDLGVKCLSSMLCRAPFQFSDHKAIKKFPLHDK